MLDILKVQKLYEWSKLAIQLAALKQTEMELRKECALFALVEYKPEAFKEQIDIGNGYKLKAENVINYKLDSVERVEQICDELMKAGFTEIPAKVFKWKPELSLSFYKTLTPTQKAIVDQVVSTSIGSPKLEIIEPKKKV